MATTVTATLGVAITKICEEYTKACIENGGSKDLMITKISDYFTVENLKKVMKEISKGKDQKIVERIVKAVVDMFKDTKKGARKIMEGDKIKTNILIAGKSALAKAVC